jgi:mono/diheme cytochrome c family protein
MELSEEARMAGTTMRWWKKLVLGGLGVIAALVVALVSYVELRWDRRYDDIAGPDLRASTDPAVIARGKYLVRGPAHCSNCHVSTFDEFMRSDRGEELPLRGGLEFPMLPLGYLYPKNLTNDAETGIGRYPDRVVFRMMRNSVKPNGTATMSVLMPFHRMADDDLVAVVSYLRSLAPVRNEVPEPRYTFLGKTVRTFAPLFRPVLADGVPQVAPPEAPTRERGEYLARYVSNCVGCHTATDIKSGRIIGPDFAGGFEFEPPPVGVLGSDGHTWYRSPNLTPDPTGVLGKYPDKAEWIKRFRQGRVLPGSPMHWGPFSRMSDVDLEALLVFLKSLAPVKNDIGVTAYRKDR